jgi:hypothetical protein
MDFIIEKQENKLWRNTKAWKQYLNDLPPGRYKVIIEQEDKRTGQQNKWLHSILPEIVMGLRGVGYNDVKTPEDAKDVIKAIFFKKEVTNGTETIEVIQGTSKTSKLDFASKADEIIRWASEYLGIDVAPPSEQTEIFKHDMVSKERK